ncbi:MAG: hypothetical protein EA412_05000 [Chitinophagaceae bacterium]|nr:MAG: hypothetical protein EA412_05000 [Chitinophagaceae bacterium]
MNTYTNSLSGKKVKSTQKLSITPEQLNDIFITQKKILMILPVTIRYVESAKQIETLIKF